ncbi:Cof-type HAD-IIB family hydrolase [Paenibacillus sp. HJL G12]|uniref:Cof-type HAD-IIB family hydrolase n=1 Tax=Paenibacillus dendrobii TaxID=2691084 RepID=A0A7X3IG61_9BACL|nr:Cof-type HAD-IIB family hydrolase [Paenibacillus dendrobii]MWV43332.1 Cof-type HAD-IIB family hydrolase [Paenibacillus dendrobii]
MYKIVFFDVDGTLLSETDKSMSHSTRQAIVQLMDKGIKVVVATGRPYSLCHEFKALGVDTFISANGALVKCNEEIIHKHVLTAETVRNVSAFAELNGHSVSYFTEKYLMNGIGHDNQRVVSALEETLSIIDFPEKSSLAEEIYGMCLYADDSEAQKFVNQFPFLQFKRWHHYVMSVFEKSVVTKSSAIHKVLEHFGLNRSEAIAFGDGGNDVDMLEYVGLGIAMGNGEQRLKETADFVTKKASEDGIAFALKKFGII